MRRLIRLGAAALAAVVLHAPVLAADPPRVPVLRVEATMHVNLVRAVAVDSAGRWAVTASDDKTARVWDVATGAPGPVLRVPVAEGDEGRLQAVVLSPDGAQVAVAGNTGRAWDGSNSIYVFDRATGSLLRRIDTRSASSVVTMDLSPDGRTLAVGLGGKGGLKLFDFASGAAQGSDATNYSDSIYALDFTPDSKRLVSGGADGRLHVYEVNQGQLKRLGGGRPEGGRLIAQARFSPDGQLIALGFEDSPQPQVLSAADLSVVARPAVGDAAPGAFSSLAWSPDGSELWGGGAHRDPAGSQWLLRVWPRSNFASFADRQAAHASILAIGTLPRQRVVFASAEPAWGVVDASAQVQRKQQSGVASFNSLARQFQVSADARKLRFWFAYKQPLNEFELGTRALRAAEGAAGFAPPRLEAPGLRIENWENGRGPVLNGQRLPLPELETARALSIAADGRSFVLGTDEGLWTFDASGKPLWNKRTPALVWAVNQSADGKLLVAAGQDGVLRWYRARDGQELLALLPNTDRRRWIAWSPSGYFDAAVGAEELLGWHVNRRASERPDFFPLRTLRARFYRPDVIDRVLDLADEGEALRAANTAANRGPEPELVLAESLPPVLENLGTAEMRGIDGEMKLRIRLRSQADAPITSLQARAEGRPAQAELLAGNGDEREVRVRFSGQPQNLTLIAENKYGRSAPASVTVSWPEAAAPAAAAAPATPVAAAPVAATPAAPAAAGGAGFDRKPRLYVLAIGVGKFSDAQVPPLDLTSKDVRDFVTEIKKQQGKLYRQVDVKLLVDQGATRDSIMDGLDWLQRQVTQHDVGILFVAGHGDNDAELGYIYIPHNFSFDAKRRTAVSFKEFQKTLDALTGKAVFFVDTCHSGNVLGEKRRAMTRSADNSGAINDLLSAESGVVVFSASTGRQYALEDKAWGNGAFTKALVEGLSGKADFSKKGFVSHKMLDFYISDRVKDLTKGKQTPVTQAPGGVPDFPLAVVK